MDISARTAVLRALDNFVRNYRLANGEQERERVNYHANGFIDTMTFDASERQDLREIYTGKIGIREKVIASVQ